MWLFRSSTEWCLVGRCTQLWGGGWQLAAIFSRAEKKQLALVHCGMFKFKPKSDTCFFCGWILVWPVTHLEFDAIVQCRVAESNRNFIRKTKTHGMHEQRSWIFLGHLSLLHSNVFVTALHQWCWDKTTCLGGIHSGISFYVRNLGVSHITYVDMLYIIW